MHGRDIIEIEDLMNFFCADNFGWMITFLNSQAQAESYIGPLLLY